MSWIWQLFNPIDFNFRPSRKEGEKTDVSDGDGVGPGGREPGPGGGGSGGGTPGIQVSQQRQWGFRRDARGSDRRRRVSTIHNSRDPTQPPEIVTGEPSRGQGLRFHVPPKPGGPGRKASTSENPTKTASAPIGREAIVYSPASSAYSMASSARGSTPGSDMFFASGIFNMQYISQINESMLCYLTWGMSQIN